jgi:hypothetical protein
MGMKKFAYLFPMGPSIVVSRENLVQLQHRMQREPQAVQDEVADFIKNSSPGDDMVLPTGEFIFCVALS